MRVGAPPNSSQSWSTSGGLWRLSLSASAHTPAAHGNLTHYMLFWKRDGRTRLSHICTYLLSPSHAHLTSRLSCLPYTKWGNWSRKDADRSLAFAGSLGYLLTRAVGSWETRACAPSTGVILLGQAQRNWECFEECCHDNRVFPNRRVLSSRKFGRVSPENNPWTQISNGK